MVGRITEIHDAKVELPLCIAAGLRIEARPAGSRRAACIFRWFRPHEMPYTTLPADSQVQSDSAVGGEAVEDGHGERGDNRFRRMA